MGHHVWNHTIFKIGSVFPLAKVPIVYPRQHTCGFVSPSSNQLDNTPVYEVRNLGGSNSDFSWLIRGFMPFQILSGSLIPPLLPSASFVCLDLLMMVRGPLITTLPYFPNSKPALHIASTGRIVGVSPSVICHNASTLRGFSGSPGVNLNTSGGMKFSFIHTGNQPLSVVLPVSQ